MFPGELEDFYRRSEVMRAYFTRVLAAEREVFGAPRFGPRNVTQLAIRSGDLSRMSLDSLAPALEADRYIVFGASYIRGPLCDFLVARGALNLHMGVSPFYRGSSTNFWALYDERPWLVGATIHRLTRGLDSGPILFHAMPRRAPAEPFELGMLAVRAAQRALAPRLASGEIDALEPVAQDRRREFRYTRNRDFTDAVAAEYLARLKPALDIGAALSAADDAPLIRPIFI